MTFRSIIASLAAALTLVTLTSSGAAAAESVTSERYAGVASGRTVEIGLPGHGVALGAGVAGADLDPVHDDVSVSAAGVGATSEETTIVAAGMGEQREGCAVPDLARILATARLDVGLACGTADVTGSGLDFTATGSGSVASVNLSVADLLAGLLDVPELAGLLDEAFGALDEVADTAADVADESVDPAAAEAVGLLNSTLDAALGTGDVVPNLDVSDTLGDLIERLRSARLLSVDLGVAKGEIVADADSMTARASDDGAVVELVPGFMPDGSALAKVTVAGSAAEVVYHRADASAEGSSSGAKVTVETPLFNESVELAPGETLELFCENDGPLCTEIAVNTASEQQRDGRLRVDASLVTIHAAKNLTSLLDLDALAGLPILGDVLAGASGSSAGTLGDALASAGLLDEGVATSAGTDEGGLRLVLAGASAEAGGTKVLDRVETATDSQEPFQGELPRTGAGPAFPFVAGLLGASAGLRALVSRTRGAHERAVD